MRWRLDRDWPLLTRTIGRLYECAANTPDPAKWCDGDTWLCYTGEDRIRGGPTSSDGPKVFGQTCIPAGTYEVVLDYSNRFKKVMPHVLNVTGYDGIRFHGARSAVPVEVSTEGCICVGMEKDSEDVYTCPPAMAKVVALLGAAAKRNEKVWLTIPEVLHAPTEV
jgi:hypothetical protein